MFWHFLDKSRQKHFSNENVSCSKLCYFTVSECQRSEQRPGGLFIAHSARDRKGELPDGDPGNQVNDFTQHLEFTPICMVS